nr:TfoX/Sxy family protein [uncultured Albidiferax sp.]
MASHPSTAEFLLDQLAATGAASVRRMFGEYCVYLAGKPVALLCDNQLFLKPTEASRVVPAGVGHCGGVARAEAA